MIRGDGCKAAVRALDIEAWFDLAKTGATPAIKLNVVGNSMWPMIRSRRDTVTVLSCPETVQTGDVVLFRDERQAGRYVLHRVRAVQGGKLQTRGDGCWVPDGWISQEAVLGIASAVQRGRLKVVRDSLIWRLFGFWNRLEPLRRGAIRVRECMRGVRVRRNNGGEHDD